MRLFAAAMKPAGQRREDMYELVNYIATVGPQWSPPTSGETAWPVWGIHGRVAAAAMEPVIERRAASA